MDLDVHLTREALDEEEGGGGSASRFPARTYASTPSDCEVVISGGQYIMPFRHLRDFILLKLYVG